MRFAVAKLRRSSAHGIINPEPLLIAYATAIIVLFILMPETERANISLSEITTYICIACAVCVVHLASNREANWFRIDTLFVLSFMIVNFQWSAMVVISNILPGYDEAYRVDKNLTNRFEMFVTYTTWLGALGITGWAAGFVAVRDRRPRAVAGRSGAPDWPAIQIRGLALTRLITLSLLGLFVALAGANFLSGAANSEALESITGTITGPAAYAQMLLKTAMVGLIASEFFAILAKKRSGSTTTIATFLRNPGLLICIPYIGIFYLAGERGEMIQVFALIGILLGMHFRAFRAWEFVGAIVFGALLFTIIGHTRAYGWGEIDQFLANFNPWRATVNLANSAICAFVAIELHEWRGTYYWGQLLVTNILGVVPFAQSVVTSALGISSVDLNSAYTFAVYLYGPNPHTGPGTSIIADAYINFGPVGLVVVLFAYGAVCKTMTEFLREATSLPAFGAAAAFASLIFYMPRASVFTQLQPAIWAAGFAMLFYKLRLSHLRPTETPSQIVRSCVRR